METPEKVFARLLVGFTRIITPTKPWISCLADTFADEYKLYVEVA